MKKLNVETHTYFRKESGQFSTVVFTALVIAVTIAISQQAAAAPSAVLKIIKSFNPESITINEFSTLTIGFNNANAEAITFTSAYIEKLPIGMVILGSASTSCEGTLMAETGNSLITLINAKIPAYASCQILVGVTAIKAGRFESKTQPSSMQTEKGNRLSTREAVLTAVKPVLMDLRIKKTFNPTFIKLNEFTTLNILLSNPNSETAKFENPFSDYLPEGMIILGSASTSCEGKLTAKTGTSKVILTDVEIPAYGSCVILVGVTAPQPKSDLDQIIGQPTANLSPE